jgi:hypothetical protein
MLQYFFQHYCLAKVERPFEQLEAPYCLTTNQDAYPLIRHFRWPVNLLIMQSLSYCQQILWF